MLPRLHPLSKTSIEARRAIQRLENYVETNPDDDHVKDGAVSVIIQDLKSVRSHIPKALRDPDLQEA